MEKDEIYYLVDNLSGRKEYLKLINSGGHERSGKVIKEIYDIKMGKVFISNTIELSHSDIFSSRYYKKISYEEYIKGLITQIIEETEKTIELLNINIVALNNFIEKENISSAFYKAIKDYDMSEKQIKLFKK